MAKSKGSHGQQSDGFGVNGNGGLMRVAVHVTGISPMLHNAVSNETLLGLLDKTGKKSKTAANPTPRELAASKVHTLADGRPHVPARMMMACLIKAGQYIRLDGQRQLSTATSTIIFGVLAIEDIELPLYAPAEQTPAAWEVDLQFGRNPGGKEGVCICRPRFDQWELRMTVEIDQSQLPEVRVRELFDIAGKRSGLGDFRPACRGPYGRFGVTRWEPIKI